MNRYTQPDFAASALVTIDTQRDVPANYPNCPRASVFEARAVEHATDLQSIQSM